MPGFGGVKNTRRNIWSKKTPLICGEGQETLDSGRTDFEETPQQVRYKTRLISLIICSGPTTPRSTRTTFPSESIRSVVGNE